MRFNISPSVLSEDWFHLRNAGLRTPYTYAVLYRMATKGRNGKRLEVVRAANGVLATSIDAIARYELAINIAELDEANG